MKQLYILALGGLLSFSAQAQFNQPSAAAKEDMAPRYKVTAVQQNADREVFWNNDISTCADFTFGNGSMEVGQPWTDIDISFLCSTEGPAGFYNQWAGGTGDGSAAPAINSASADNGFLMVDSDLFGAEANYAADWVENCWAQTAEPIDCSAHPYVSIAMQTRYRCWDNGASDGSEKCFIEVSRDGVTWPTLTNAYTTTWADEGMVDYDGTMVQCRYNVFPDSETGFESDNPSLLEFDITEAAGGQSTVWIRFRWVGTWGYSWEIDDLEVYDTPQHDIRIDNYVSYTNYAQTGRYEYGAWPESQLPSDLQAGIKVYNVGYDAQTNVGGQLAVNGQENYGSNTISAFPYAAVDTLVIPYQPGGYGVQTLDYQVSADSLDEYPQNNSAAQTFEVTEFHFGRDNGVLSGPFPSDGTDDYIAMPLYDIVNDVTIYGIDVAILDGSEVGTPLRVFLVDMFDDLALTEQYGGELIGSAEVDMASGYTNSGDGDVVWYTFLLEQPYQASAGQWLGAAFEHYGGANVQIGEAQYTYDQTAFVYGPFGAGSAYDWYFTNEVPMVRLNLDPNAQPPVIPGCTDPSACNYSPNATSEDGSCEYVSCAGCTDSGACNYDFSATIEDGSCDFECIGCTDPTAVNYEIDNTIEDGSCIYFEASCAFLGSSEWQNLDLGIHAQNALVHTFASDVVQEVVLNLPALIQEPTSGSNFSVMEWADLVVSGMPNGLAFDSLPTTALGNTQTCVTYSGMPLETGLFTVTLTGNLVLSVFGNPYPIGPYASTFDVEVLANPNPIPGCTYPNATNYLSYATIESGTCSFEGCMDPEANNFQIFALSEDGSCEYEACTTACPGDVDGDGSVGTGDLLSLLSSFGLVCE
jgi:hypothetical protein